MSWHLSEKRVYVRADDDDRIICAMGAGTTNAEAYILASAPDVLRACRKLLAEVTACIGIATPEIREAVGNTNFTLLALRCSEAVDALLKAEGRDNG